MTTLRKLISEIDTKDAACSYCNRFLEKISSKPRYTLADS